MMFWLFQFITIAARRNSRCVSEFFNAMDYRLFLSDYRVLMRMTFMNECLVSLISSLSSLTADHHPGSFPIPHIHQPHLDPASGGYCEQL